MFFFVIQLNKEWRTQQQNRPGNSNPRRYFKTTQCDMFSSNILVLLGWCWRYGCCAHSASSHIESDRHVDSQSLVIIFIVTTATSRTLEYRKCEFVVVHGVSCEFDDVRLANNHQPGRIEIRIERVRRGEVHERGRGDRSSAHVVLVEVPPSSSWSTNWR